MTGDKDVHCGDDAKQYSFTTSSLDYHITCGRFHSNDSLTPSGIAQKVLEYDGGHEGQNQGIRALPAIRAVSPFERCRLDEKLYPVPSLQRQRHVKLASISAPTIARHSNKRLRGKEHCTYCEISASVNVYVAGTLLLNSAQGNASRGFLDASR